MIYLDTETVGFHGLPLLIQYAIDEGEVQMHNVWKSQVGETKELIAKITEQEVCGFNLAFDWFHLCKTYTIWDLMDEDAIPEDCIEEIAIKEPMARTGKCLKPKAALDLMLHARKGPFQSLMDRSDIFIRRVPAVLAPMLAAELERRIELDGIYFSGRKDKYAPKWQVKDIVDDEGIIDSDFKNVVLAFNASGKLKNLAVHIGLAKPEDLLMLGREVGVEDKFRPVEFGFAPFAMAIGKPGNWKGTWPDVIQRHIDYWSYNPLARKYASNDIVYTRGLRHYFNDPPAGDNDSELACMVGAVRWHGYTIDTKKILELRTKAIERSHLAPKDPQRVKDYILPVLDETERLCLLDPQGKTSTKKPFLEAISRWQDDAGAKHPAAIRAKEVLDARKAKKEWELYDKLLVAGRLHASFVVIGTLSSRMAGADGLNAQGINHKTEVRACFPLADTGYVLCGGDFESFEVVLADAVYDDPALRAEITTEYPCDWCTPENRNPKCKKCEGTGLWTKKIHALFAMELYPSDTYDMILKSKGSDDDRYLKGKSGVFSQIYGGDENTIKNKLAIDIEVALRATQNFSRKYAGVGKARRRIFDKFCSMRQPKGIGTAVVWNEPADYIESLFGFRRYFTLENKICKALFQLANDPPASWKALKIKVVRRERIQTAAGAAMSAIYGAAFQIQASNMRAAANHEIQSSGAEITKTVQRNVWDIQPSGINEWRVIPMNIHDEILTPTLPEYVPVVEETVRRTVESFRKKVPLIAIDWKNGLSSWAAK